MRTATKSKHTMRPLGEVAEFLRGITFKPEDVVERGTENSVVCMRTKNVQADLDQSDLIAVPNQFVKRGELYLRESDILVSTANSWNLVGKCSWVPRLDYDATAGGFISILRADKKKIYPRYLYYWFSSEAVQHAVRLCGRQTTNISNMSFERCEELEIPLPPLPEQKRIADILDKADAIRRKRQEAIALLEQTVLSYYEEIVGDPLNNPHGWAMTTLGERVEFVTGFAFQSSRYADNNGIKLLRGANVLPDQVEWSDTCYWPVGDSVDDRFHLAANDVVLAMDRPWISTGIKVARVSKSDLPCYLVQRVARLRSASNVSQAFIYYSLRHPAFTTHCGNRKTETTVPHISPHDIRSFPIPDLPRKVHDRFSSTVSLLDRTIWHMHLAGKDSLKIFYSLVQRAFRGEL